MDTETTKKLKNPNNFISRELSWLRFNTRVLDEAKSTRHPLLERLKFIAIYGTNLAIGNKDEGFSNIFFGTKKYGNIVFFSAISLLISTNSGIVAAPTRIQNRRKIYVVSGLLSSIGGYFISIVLLWGGYSYFGLIYSNIIMGVVLLIFFFVLNTKFFSFGKFDKNIAKELFKIGLPLLPTFLIYWVY